MSGMPKPSAGHERFARMAGNREGEETMHPSDWDPKGGTATGRTRGRVALNGFALIYDYEQERNGAITYSGHGVFTFDPKAELYSLHWFDSMGSPPDLHREVRGGSPDRGPRRAGNARAHDPRLLAAGPRRAVHGDVAGRRGVEAAVRRGVPKEIAGA